MQDQKEYKTQQDNNCRIHIHYIIYNMSIKFRTSESELNMVDVEVKKSRVQSRDTQNCRNK